jgi:hypothetical protein
MKKKFLAFIFIMSSQLAFASTGAGNGGDAIVCPDSVVLLDSYEARQRQMPINLDSDEIKEPTHRSMVSVAVKRLAQKDEHTAGLLYTYAMEMVSDLEQFKIFPEKRGEHTYLGYDVISEINDSYHRSIPEGCELRQLVSQKVPRFSRDYRYIINKKYWEQMSLFEQSMTILHEAWYRIMLENDAQDSEATRYMNGLIASTDFKDLSFVEYINELKNTEKKKYIVTNNSSLVLQETIGINLQSPNLIIDEENDKICGFRQVVKVNVKKVMPIVIWHLGLYKIRFKRVCVKNSRLESLVTSDDFGSKRANFVFKNYLIRNNGTTQERPVLYFHPNGAIKSFEGFKFEALYELFYEDDGSGPYLNHKTKVKNPANIQFDDKEELLSVESN